MRMPVMPAPGSSVNEMSAGMASNQAWLALSRREVWAELSPTCLVALNVPLS